MLDITPADAVAVGTLALGIAAFWKGTRAGENARGRQPPPDTAVSIAGAVFADSLQMQRMTEALVRIADIMDRHNQAEQEREKDRVTLALDRLTAILEEREAHPGRRR